MRDADQFDSQAPERPDESHPQRDKIWLHVLLFVTTCATTTFWGALYVGAGWSDWWRGLAYSGPLMAILLTHEMGHYLAARRHDIAVSLPYFIPFPFGLGTLGAVISMRQRIASRNALVDVGAAGPLAGAVVAVLVLAVGLAHSPVDLLPLGASTASEGNSLLYMVLKRLILGRWLPSGRLDVFLSPTAFAGWIGLLVTMINLLPIGQLDGGHVAFAVLGDHYEKYSAWFHRSLPVLGAVAAVYVALKTAGQVAPQPQSLLEQSWRLWPLVGMRKALWVGISAAMPWLIWPLLLSFFKKLSGGRYHPPVGTDPLTARRKLVAALTALLFLATFTPVPMQSL